MPLPLSIIQPGIYSAGKKIVPAFSWGSAGYYFVSDKALFAFDPATDTLLRRDFAGAMINNTYNLAYIPGLKRLVATAWTSAAVGGMYYSDDFGLTWTKAPVNAATWDADVGYILVQWIPAQNQLIGGKNITAGARDIVKSSDGINWTSVAGLGSAGIAGNHNCLCYNANGDVGVLQYNGGENRAFTYNTDNVASSTWSIVGIGIASGLATECPNGDFVAFGTTGGGTARIRSTNGGQTWAADGTPHANMVNAKASLSRMMMFSASGRYYSDANAAGGWTLCTPSIVGGAAQLIPRKDVNDFLILETNRTIRKTDGITMVVSPTSVPADIASMRGGLWVTGL